MSGGVVTREERGSLYDGAVFDRLPGMTAAARDFAAGFLARARTERAAVVPDRVDGAVRLVVSELMTNATRYAPGPYPLELELTGEGIRVTVWDSDPSLPTPRACDPDRVGQHGLEIVLALCASFDVERRGDGKRVSALVALARPPRPGA